MSFLDRVTGWWEWFLTTILDGSVTEFYSRHAATTLRNFFYKFSSNSVFFIVAALRRRVRHKLFSKILAVKHLEKQIHVHRGWKPLPQPSNPTPGSPIVSFFDQTGRCFGRRRR
jgi:hypothetical protein